MLHLGSEKGTEKAMEASAKGGMLAASATLALGFDFVSFDA